MPMFDFQTMTIHVKHILVNERMYTHPLLAVDAEERKMQQNALLFIFKKNHVSVSCCIFSPSEKAW